MHVAVPITDAITIVHCERVVINRQHYFGQQNPNVPSVASFARWPPLLQYNGIKLILPTKIVWVNNVNSE